MTVEQVCRALHELCRGWLRRRRRSGALACVLAIIGYHQRRNGAARESKRKRVIRARVRKKPRPRKRKRRSRCTVSSR